MKFGAIAPPATDVEGVARDGAAALRQPSTCSAAQVLLCAVALLFYGLVGFSGSISGQVIGDSSLGWAVNLVLLAAGRTVGSTIAGVCMVNGENRKAARIRAASSRNVLGSERVQTQPLARWTLCRFLRHLRLSPESRVQGGAAASLPQPVQCDGGRSESPVGGYGGPGSAAADSEPPSAWTAHNHSKLAPEASRKARAPETQAPGNKAHSASTPSLVNLLVVVVGQMLGAGGYVPFFFLSRTGDVSLIAPLMSLHTLFPIIYGFCTGEPVSWAKVIGILTSFAAVLLLGADSISGPAPADPSLLGLQIGLLSACTCMWGLADLIAVKFGRRLRHKHVLLAQLAGVSICGVIGGVSIVVTAIATGPDMGPIVRPAPAGQLPGVLAGFQPVHGALLIAAGHALGALGWLAYVRLGQLGDASAFAPVVQLYGVVSALFGFLLLDERAGAFKVAGIVVAVSALLLLGLSPSQARLLSARICGTRGVPTTGAASTAGTAAAGCSLNEIGPASMVGSDPASASASKPLGAFVSRPHQVASIGRDLAPSPSSLLEDPQGYTMVPTSASRSDGVIAAFAFAAPPGADAAPMCRMRDASSWAGRGNASTVEAEGQQHAMPMGGVKTGGAGSPLPTTADLRGSASVARATDAVSAMFDEIGIHRTNRFADSKSLPISEGAGPKAASIGEPEGFADREVGLRTPMLATAAGTLDAIDTIDLGINGGDLSAPAGHSFGAGGDGLDRAHAPISSVGETV